MPQVSASRFSPCWLIEGHSLAFRSPCCRRRHPPDRARAKLRVRGDDPGPRGHARTGRWRRWHPVGEAAIAFVFEEAALRGAPLVAVHTWQETAFDIAMNTDIAVEFWRSASE